MSVSNLPRCPPVGPSWRDWRSLIWISRGATTWWIGWTPGPAPLGYQVLCKIPSSKNNDSYGGWLGELPFHQWFWKCVDLLFIIPLALPQFILPAILLKQPQSWYWISDITLLSFLIGNFRDKIGYRADLGSALSTCWLKTVTCWDPWKATCITMMITLPMDYGEIIVIQCCLPSGQHAVFVLKIP